MTSRPETTPTPIPSSFFFFNDTATTEIYPLSLHDALPISNGTGRVVLISGASSGIGRAIAELLANRGYRVFAGVRASATTDRKSTRLNSSHLVISYAVFCLKKKT